MGMVEGSGLMLTVLMVIMALLLNNVGAVGEQQPDPSAGSGPFTELDAFCDGFPHGHVFEKELVCSFPLPAQHQPGTCTSVTKGLPADLLLIDESALPHGRSLPRLELVDDVPDLGQWCFVTSKSVFESWKTHQ